MEQGRIVTTFVKRGKLALVAVSSYADAVRIAARFALDLREVA